MNEKKNVLCFGDSLTWGWVPKENAVPTERYPSSVRWTGLLAEKLGEEFTVIEEGLSGRTTGVDDPTDSRLNATTYLPSCLATHLPLDVVVLMLGTNDTKAYFHRSAFEIATGVSVLLGQIATSAGGVGTAYPAPKVLLVSPPPLGNITNPWFEELFAGGQEKTAEFGQLYKAVAEFMGVAFLDAGTVISTDGVDGIHFTPQNNAELAEAIYAEIAELL